MSSEFTRNRCVIFYGKLESIQKLALALLCRISSFYRVCFTEELLTACELKPTTTKARYLMRPYRTTVAETHALQFDTFSRYLSICASSCDQLRMALASDTHKTLTTPLCFCSHNLAPKTWFPVSSIWQRSEVSHL